MVNRKYSKRDKRHYWGFDVTINGTRIRDYVYDDKQKAEAVLFNLKYGPRRTSEEIEKDPIKLKDLIEIKVAGITRKNESTRSKRVLSDFLDCCPSREIAVEDVTYRDLQKYVAKRTTEKLMPASVNRELNIIAATLHRAAIEYEELQSWRAPRIPRFKIPKQKKPRTMSSADRDRLLGWLRRPREQGEQLQTVLSRERVAYIVEFALLTGLRHTEVLRLTWGDIDTDGQSITVYGSKTEQVRYLPLTDRLNEIIFAQKRHSSFIFNQGGQITPKFYKVLKRACNAVGIVYGHKLNGFVLHSARHTFVSRLLQAGVDLATVQSLSGHSDRTMALHYSHATEETRREAMLKLDISKEKGRQ